MTALPAVTQLELKFTVIGLALDAPVTVKSSEVELYAASDPIPAARESKVTFTGDTENAN